MKKSLILLAAITLIPSIASTAVTTDKEEATATTATATTETTIVESSTTVDLSQFTASDMTGMGAISATVVSTPGDKGRAEATLTRAMTRARSFAMEVPSLQEKLDHLVKGEHIELSPEAFNFIQRAKELASQTNGWFDPTAPSSKSSFLKKDWRRIRLNPETRNVWLRSNDLKFDLGRIATGYAADIMMEELNESGFANAMVEVGQVHRNKGHDIFTPWNVTIGFGESPTQTGAYRAYRYNIKDVGAATVTPDGLGSGLIDSQNKKTVETNGVRSVTVFAHDATTATAFAIAAYTLGPKHGLRYIEAHPEMMCVIVDHDGTLFASKNMLITNAPERTAIRQASASGGTNDLKQRQREESLEQ